MNLVQVEQVVSLIMCIYLVLLIGCALWLNIVAYKRFKVYNQYKSSIKILEINYGERTPVSLLVPAYNEEVTIVATIESLLTLDYENYEIIIVNDGSTDETSQRLQEAFKFKPIQRKVEGILETQPVENQYIAKVNGIEVTLINKVNGGKADSLNVGINYSKYPVFVAIDADCLLLKDALKKIMVPFVENRHTIAAGGNVKIANHTLIQEGKLKVIQKPKELVVYFQIIEYLRAFLTCRMSLDRYNMNFIISGAFGAFKRSAVIDVGGYRVNTVGEDMELVMRMHQYYLNAKMPYRIGFAADAYCYTQAPNKLKGLKIQRRRWQMGLMQSMMLHPTFFKSRSWFMTKSYYILTELITPILEVFGFVFFVILAFAKMINLPFVLGLFFVYLFMNTMFSVVAILLEVYTFHENTHPKLILRLLALSVVESLGYRQLLSLYRLSAFIGYRKNKHRWGSITRFSQNV